MKKDAFFITLIVYCCFFFNLISCTQDTASTTSLEKPINKQGYISFTLHTDKTYSNGTVEDEFTQKLLELPGLATCGLVRKYEYVGIGLRWEREEIPVGFLLQMKDLPGPQKYHFQFTWDAEKGLFDGYMNGISFRTENMQYYYPWEVKGSAAEFKIPEGPNRVTDVQILSSYVPEDKAIENVPKELFGKMDHLFRTTNFPEPLNIDDRKSRLLYSSKMNNQASVKDWVLEGPAEISFEDDKMIMRSKIPNPQDGSTGHFNYWCPVDLPDSFVAEWEFQPLSERGVSLIHFAAKGQNGADIFAPSLSKRDGHFQQYANGDIMNYWIVFFSNNRRMRTTNYATTYLSKSSKSRLLEYGKIGVIPGDMEFHKLRLLKDGAHLQLLVNGEFCLDFADPGSERWGPVLGAGKISFRQMAVTVGAYRNFNVWELR